MQSPESLRVELGMLVDGYRNTIVRRGESVSALLSQICADLDELLAMHVINEEDPIPDLDRIIRENEGADTVVMDPD